MSRRASPKAVLLARAYSARKQVEKGQLDGEIALSLVMWPTDGILAREKAAPQDLLRQRAYDNGRA